MEDLVQNPTSPLCWKKYIMLPLLLFTADEDNTLAVKIKSEICVLRKHIQTISSSLLMDDWSAFTIGYSAKRKKSCSKNNAHNLSSSTSSGNLTTHLDEQVHKFVTHGELSRAMQLIESASSPSVPSPAILLALKDKFPSKDIIPISPEDP
jgi:hypothetical protein